MNGSLTLKLPSISISKKLKSKELMVTISTGRKERTLLSRLLRRKVKKEEKKPNKSNKTLSSIYSKKLTTAQVMNKTMMLSHKMMKTKLKNWKDNINYVRTFMRKSFQKVWNSFWVLLQKWVNVVEMKNVLIWLVLKKELERKVVMIQMNNES